VWRLRTTSSSLISACLPVCSPSLRVLSGLRVPVRAASTAPPSPLTVKAQSGGVAEATPPPPPSSSTPSTVAHAAASEAQTSWRMSDAAAPFSPDEVKALVFPLIPCAPSTSSSESRTSPGTTFVQTSPRAISVTEMERNLPKALRSYMGQYQLTSSPITGLGCDIWNRTRNATPDTAIKKATQLLSSGLGAYLVDHFPEELIVVMPGGRFMRRTEVTTSSGDDEDNSGVSEGRQTGVNAVSPPSSAMTAAGTNKDRVVRRSQQTDYMEPPPPPQPTGPSQRYGGPAGVAGFFGGTPLSSGDTTATTVQCGHQEKAPVPLRTAVQVMDVLVEFIPTFYISVDDVAPNIPSNVQELFAGASLRFYLKRLKHYVDLRTAFNSTEVRLKPTFDHPRRGAADARYRIGGSGLNIAEGVQNSNQLRRPPRNSEANLIGLVAPRVPKTFTLLAEVLHEIAPIISRHPAFDARLGVVGLLGKYPEYFQLINGQLRARPYRVAPNSLGELDLETSPLPHVFEKVLARVEEAAAGKNYAVATEKAAAMVSTGRLYSLLNAHEKTEVKQKCRSFPTFLRLHGKDLVVSVDKMRVYKFIPEHEACVDTLMDERLRMNSLDPNDPILKIPAEMAPESNADWAVRELYDALPLVQCAELDEVLSLVPPAVRDALPKEVAGVRSLLEQYSEYFSIWPYPDDEDVIVVQRAKVEQPVLDQAEIVRMVVPLIPQGGTTLTSLRTRAPLQLQRYFYRHGTVATLGAMKDVFAIAGERIVRLV
jgi:hypothetical protein